MTRTYLNLNKRAWRNIRRSWDPPSSVMLYWQSFIAGALFSGTNVLQTRLMDKKGICANLNNAVVILGYWRSGTTLLHELLCASGQWGFPTTHACMNPHTFLFHHPSNAETAAHGTKRPMDDMIVTANSPQEDEFALLGLGARSPYEALLVPQKLPEALRLADPAVLSPDENLELRLAFLEFLRGISLQQDGAPLLLKTPPHAYRIGMLTDLLPDCRFVIVIRDPYEVFESAVQMWFSLFERYALTEIPSEELVRSAMVEDRLAFERKLQAGLAQLDEKRYTIVRYERFVENPEDTIVRLYDNLGLAGAETAASAAKREWAARDGYKSRSRRVPEFWARQIRSKWAGIFERYGYPL